MCLSLGQLWKVTWLKKDYDRAFKSVPSTTGIANDVLCHGNSKTVLSLVVVELSLIPQRYKTDSQNVQAVTEYKHPQTFKIFKAILVWRTITVVSPKAGRFDHPTKSTVQQRCSAWQSSLQEAFWSYQEEITSAQVLGDFDKSKPSVIQSERFQEWIRHIFVARWQDSNVYALRSLTVQRYSNIEKDGLQPTEKSSVQRMAYCLKATG